MVLSDYTKSFIKDSLNELSKCIPIVFCNNNTDNDRAIASRNTAICVVDDEFKLKYGTITLSRRKEVVKALRQINIRNAEAFKESYENCFRQMRAIAETEYEMYKAEKKAKIARKAIKN